MNLFSTVQKSEVIQKVTQVHSLGPRGTNCEKASWLWLKEMGIQGEVVLHNTLEEAILKVKENESSVLLGCAVYPRLHELVFSNLSKIELIDSFIMPTYNMVVAKKYGTELSNSSKIASHPAPVHLAYEFTENIEFVTSNSVAAINCAEGRSDACVTTLKAAQENGLIIEKEFGEVSMCFTIHGHKQYNGGL